MIPSNHRITIFTDGSCHTQLCVGAWAALIIYKDETYTLSGLVMNTTHQRMELLAVLEAIAYTKSQLPDVLAIELVSDSQYVIGLIERQAKLEANHFITKAGKSLNNADLIKRFYASIQTITIHFIKIKAHQVGDDAAVRNNNTVDQLCRQLVRTTVDTK